MKGVESIVGAYLAVIIVIGTMFAFHTWISSYTKSINDQVNNVISTVQVVSYPPVISIKYANETHFVLAVTPYAPIRIKDLVLRSPDNELVYHLALNELVLSTTEFPVERPSKPVLVYFVTEGGFVFYYVPRLDPGLQNAPDNIKNKVYVDNELLDYVAKGLIDSGSWVLMEAQGSKLAWGSTRLDLVNSTLLRGPVVCSLVVHIPCNVNMTSLENSVLTNWFNSTSSIPGFRHSGGFLEFVHYSGNYTQIYRMIKFTGGDEITFIVNITLRAVGAYTGVSHAVYFIPVVYLYDAGFNPVFPVTLYQLRIYYNTELPGEAMRPWHARIPLTDNILFWNSTSYYVGVFEVKLNPRDYGLYEGYVLVGVEAVVVIGIESFNLRVLIDVKAR
jgi:hypothetical protein